MGETHTPGPWKAVPDDDNYIKPDTPDIWGSIVADAELGGHWYIARVWDCGPYSPVPAPANASLMAAAPDMLEALRHALDAVPRDFEAFGLEGVRTVDIISAAIAKAEGR